MQKKKKKFVFCPQKLYPAEDPCKTIAFFKEVDPNLHSEIVIDLQKADVPCFRCAKAIYEILEQEYELKVSLLNVPMWMENFLKEISLKKSKEPEKSKKVDLSNRKRQFQRSEHWHNLEIVSAAI